MCSGSPSSTLSSRTRALLAGAVVAAVALACSSAPRRASPSLTAAELDVDTGACLCRLPQDELTSCCRAGMVLECVCDGNWSCHMVPVGRQCGSAFRR